MSATLALACIASAAPAQTVVGRESSAGKYNRLRDVTVRPQNAIAPADPDIFGTSAIGAGVTFYDARFRRVANTDRAHPLVMEMADTVRRLPPAQQLLVVDALVREKVRWAHDLDTMKVADLWANAGETLERGAGDSEDIAVVKMQVLKAAGWNPRDLYISIGREKGVGPHIILIARTAGGFYVLDDRARQPVAAGVNAKFTPILTLGEGKSWVHGRRVTAAPRISSK